MLSALTNKVALRAAQRAPAQRSSRTAVVVRAEDAPAEKAIAKARRARCGPSPFRVSRLDRSEARGRGARRGVEHAACK